MKILYATSEMTPFVKTGGLADVAGALPRAMAERGHEVAVVMPFYGSIAHAKWPFREVMPELFVHLPLGTRALSVWAMNLECDTAAGGSLRLYLIKDDGLFDRPQLYTQGGVDYADNSIRFAYFCLAALWMLRGENWLPEVIHCNDWQTAMIPCYLKYWSSFSGDPEYSAIRTVLSIHNLAYQGVFPMQVRAQIGLPPEVEHPDAMEFWGQLNFLKGAIMTADHISTVSRTYAREIRTEEFGCGLQGVLESRKDALTGIINGIDTGVWNPATDPHLQNHYDAKRLDKKAKCKADLQKAFELPQKADVPLMAVISRLTDQKGFDLIAEILPELLKGKQQLVLLGTGEPKYHEMFAELAAEFPKSMGVKLGFDEGLAHRIEAGADLFLMPSRFEPCGLNQLYSLRYGTIPIVRRVGGLADSIVNATPSALEKGKATGFVFTPYESKALLNTVKRALKLYRKDPKAWRKLVTNAMEQDFSWQRSAKRYEMLMKQLVKPAKAEGAEEAEGTE